MPAAALGRDVDRAAGRTPELDDVLLAVYAADGGPAQVCERLVDLDEGLQEWRYRHAKMVERTIGDKPGTGGLLRRRLPPLHAVHAAVPRPLGHPQPALTPFTRRTRVRRRRVRRSAPVGPTTTTPPP